VIWEMVANKVNSIKKIKLPGQNISKGLPLVSIRINELIVKMILKKIQNSF
jgi:hypothetical protein